MSFDIENTLKEYLSLARQYISFESISTLVNVSEIEKCSQWLYELFNNHGFKTEVMKGFDNPIIFAQLQLDDKLPTVLIYGHYDVQPASEEEWGRNPFKLLLKDEKLFARGIVDNKGQLLIHFVTIIRLLEEKNLHYNVKFVIEGNEETGSPNIGEFIKQYKNKLESDFILISDSAKIKDHPTIEMSLRGVLNTSLVIKTSEKDLHSGLFGGAVPNSAQIVSNFINKLKDDNGKVLIDGFYSAVFPVESKLIKFTEMIFTSETELLNLTGTKKLIINKGQNFFSQVGLNPTVEVTGLQSGYTGQGYRNSIPSSAIIKLNFRLVPDQDPQTILEKFKDFTKRNLPDYIEYEFVKPDKTEGVVKPIMLNIDNKYVSKAKKILEEVYNEDVYFDFNGATLPIVVEFVDILNSDILMVALGNEDCKMHAVDENFDLQSIKKALEFSYKFLSL